MTDRKHSYGVKRYRALLGEREIAPEFETRRIALNKARLMVDGEVVDSTDLHEYA